MYEVTESRTGILQCDTAISKKVVGNSASDNPNGVVGGFEFTVLQSSLKEWHERPWTCVASAKTKQQK